LIFVITVGFQGFKKKIRIKELPILGISKIQIQRTFVFWGRVGADQNQRFTGSSISKTSKTHQFHVRTDKYLIVFYVVIWLFQKIENHSYI
jgi:hypothetical protein